MIGMPARRGRLRRPLLFVALSLALHVGVAAGVALLIGDLWSPGLHVTWLDLDNRLGAPAPAGPTAPEPKPKADPAPPARPRPRAAVRPARYGDQATVARPRPTPDAGPRAAGARGPERAGTVHADKIALADLAPGDAALILLLRMDRIRGSPYEAAVRRLLEVFYDHKTILWGSGLDAVNDFDALLIATPNPYRVTETFLAARSSRPVGELRRGLERAASFGGKRLRWTPANGAAQRGEIPSPPRHPSDPRVLWLRGDVVMLTDPKLLSALSAPGPATDAGVPGSGWVARLAQMGDRGGTPGTGPGMLLEAVNLARLVALPAEVPAPQSIRGGIEARDPAQVEAALGFASEAAARGFVVEAKRRIERVRQSDDRASRLLRWLGVADLLASIRFQRRDAVVTASLQLGERDVKALLEMARSAIPQVQVPGMPERRPLDAGPPRPDRSHGVPPDAGPGPRDAPAPAP
jgi:hypothetical protein